MTATDNIKAPADISFVIPLFNHLSATQEMYSSLKATVRDSGLNTEIIFVDDGSTDETRAWLGKLSDPDVSVLLNPRNLGFAATVNAGAKIARGRVLFLLNNDLILLSGWLDPMLSALSLEDAGMVGNVQLRVDSRQIDHAGLDIFCNGKIGHLHELPQNHGDFIETFAVTGACIAIRRESFLSLGGFDTVYTNGGEDIDLCMRIRTQGLKIGVATASKVLHHVSLSRGNTSDQNERNSRLLYERWRDAFFLKIRTGWLQRLQSVSTEFTVPEVDGTLRLASPDARNDLATFLAEHVLRREEQRWARELDGIDTSISVARTCSVDPIKRTSPFSVEIRCNIQETLFARNFFVCGDNRGEKVHVTLHINDLQRKDYVADGGLFNLGIVDPILAFPGGNTITVTFQSDSPLDIIITHLVVDDGRISLPIDGFDIRNKSSDQPAKQATLARWIVQWIRTSLARNSNSQ